MTSWESRAVNSANQALKEVLVPWIVSRRPRGPKFSVKESAFLWGGKGQRELETMEMREEETNSGGNRDLNE